ncbi:hypothetical protein CDAR_386281 [Caerostris darwini]|uniref:Uncharacterized protein n=1 Tax=Caerostris darwini TaxID=1538125 RepID=A0AAV4T267_9ARAC|nr:hypothetical protein CDAR_386281 [Caerostris darwini]
MKSTPRRHWTSLPTHLSVAKVKLTDQCLGWLGSEVPYAADRLSRDLVKIVIYPTINSQSEMGWLNLHDKRPIFFPNSLMDDSLHIMYLCCWEWMAVISWDSLCKDNGILSTS